MPTAGRRLRRPRACRRSVGTVAEHGARLPATVRLDEDLRTAVSMMFMYDSAGSRASTTTAFRRRIYAAGITRLLGETYRDASSEASDAMRRRCTGRILSLSRCSRVRARRARPAQRPVRPDRQVRSDIVYLSQQHMKIVAISGGLAIAVGVPLGLWLSRRGCAAPPSRSCRRSTSAAPIPTLAVLALAMSLLGIGVRAGDLRAVGRLAAADRAQHVRGMLGRARVFRRGGDGMGMRPMQILSGVELPNALFVTFAGIRTALAINVGTAPLAFLIGGGGLGELIFTGIDLNEPAMMLAGAIPTALLAVLVDYAVGVSFWQSRGVTAAVKGLR
jgi:osmoprotectant transport system permease protein